MGRFKVKNVSFITTADKDFIDLSEYLKNQSKILLDDKLYKRPRIIFNEEKTHMFEIYDEVPDSDILSLLYNINRKLDLLLLNFNT